jgi:hypothetical protein
MYLLFTSPNKIKLLKLRLKTEISFKMEDKRKKELLQEIQHHSDYTNRGISKPLGTIFTI